MREREEQGEEEAVEEKGLERPLPLSLEGVWGSQGHVTEHYTHCYTILGSLLNDVF